MGCVCVLSAVLHEGFLSKRGRSFPWGWKKRFFRLYSRGEMMYWSSNPDTEGGTLKGTLDLRPGPCPSCTWVGCAGPDVQRGLAAFTMEDSDKKPFAVQVKVPSSGDGLLLAPYSESDRAVWVATLLALQRSQQQ